MPSPKILTNAWFERIFDTRAWDIVARVLFVVTYGSLLLAAVLGLLDVWHSRVADGWLWLEMATRMLGITNISLPILIVIVRHRPVARVHGMMPKVVALAGSFLPMSLPLLPYHQLAPVMTLISGAMLLAGGSLTAWTWLHLGRSFSIMAEARKLSRSGPYRFVRHPLYLFEEMSVVAVYILYASPAATAILAVQIACQLQRIRNEEQVLSQTFPEYRAYQRTTSKLIPGIY